MAFQWKFAAVLAVVAICFYQAQCKHMQIFEMIEYYYNIANDVMM